MQGLLPPLDAPHHVRKHEWSEFREGANLSCHVFALDFGHTMK
jgi:predicted SPOUT superfamily RNA methylase MTH1